MFCIVTCASGQNARRIVRDHNRKMSRQKEQEDKAEKNKGKCKEDRKGESNDGPETPVRGMTSNIPDFHSGDDDELMLNVLRCHLTY